ncbi:uncharacterized protein BP5553_08742 [Venustampulla echinocandica]|uniref:Uncharacterized protein n=1 Tax=Venustampulla echinocandica TaxID=2656787 RepID=A0A370TF37_9HELO|nr:uncharacterized protein BP5553_08742 [Venustampulla echinocandica]RDL33303.1 hypothetical protein BP5553_08742 [Venustampulla echinocandica]
MASGPRVMTAAVALCGPVLLEMQELMVTVGLPSDLMLEEAIGPAQTWTRHRDDMERFIYPILRMKAEMLEARGRREKEKKWA